MRTTRSGRRSPWPRGVRLARIYWVACVLGSSYVLGASTGCVGAIDDGAARPSGVGPRDDLDPTCADDRMLLGSTPMRRLSNAEYLASVAALFPGVTPALPELPPDTTSQGFENDARSLGASDVRVARWEDVAFRYTQAATASDEALAGFLSFCERWDDDASQRACGRALVDTLGRRTHRRPLTDAQRARYEAFFEAQRGEIDFAAAVQLTTMAMLQSPWFLYRLEIEGGMPRGDVVALDAWDVATRLSFLLWEEGPNDALLDAAARGELTDAASLEAHARRMLADPRARAAVLDFHRQWLDLDRIEIPEHALRIDDPEWTETTQRSAREETDRFIAHALFDGEGTLGALLTSRETYVDRELARIYGVSGPTAAGEWARATLPEGERAGLLTRAAFLAAESHAGNPSPPLRGLYVMERLLCETRPTPPPDVDLSPPTAEPGEGPRTNRQLFDERTASPTCQGCHVRMHGFGYALEGYDEAGAFRDLDDGLPVDASGSITGTDVDGPIDGAIELSERLASSERVHECATRRWVRYAQGRAEERTDACLTERLSERFVTSGGDVRELLVAMVTSPEFRHRGAVSE